MLFPKRQEDLAIGYQISHGVFGHKQGINNAGDPFSGQSFYQLNSHDDERVLVNRFAYDILKCAPKSVWGYCASGSTEAIINGLWMARKRFEEVPTVYASKDCHFCVPKAADMLCMRFESVDTDDDGCMDMDVLGERLKKAKTPSIVVLTLGTTVRNTYDNIEQFYTKVKDLSKVHVHFDAAFGGAVYPFTKPEWLLHPFDTFNVSFHKFFGCPQPCALFLVRKQVKVRIQGNGCFGKDMVCLPDKDFTISCSRNGTAVSLAHKSVCEKDFFETHVNTLNKCFRVKQFLTENIPESVSFRTNSDDGLSVELFGLPTDTLGNLVREKYSMSVRNVRNGLFDTHVYVCGHVTTDTILELVKDISRHICSSVITPHEGECRVKAE